MADDQDRVEEALRRFNQQLRAERARIQLLTDIVGRVVKLAEMVDELILYHRQQIYREEALREWLNEHSKSLDRIDQSLLHLLASRGNGDKGQIAQARQELRSDLEISSLRRQLSRQYNNLFNLQEDKANYAGHAPIELLNQIDAVEAEIERLREKIEAIEDH